MFIVSNDKQQTRQSYYYRVHSQLVAKRRRFVFAILVIRQEPDFPVLLSVLLSDLPVKNGLLREKSVHLRRSLLGDKGIAFPEDSGERRVTRLEVKLVIQNISTPRSMIFLKPALTKMALSLIIHPIAKKNSQFIYIHVYFRA